MLVSLISPSLYMVLVGSCCIVKMCSVASLQEVILLAAALLCKYVPIAWYLQQQRLLASSNSRNGSLPVLVLAALVVQVCTIIMDNLIVTAALATPDN